MESPWWTEERDNVRCTACDWSGYRYTFHPIWVGPSWMSKRNPEWEQAITRKPCPDCGGQTEVNDEEVEVEPMTYRQALAERDDMR